MENPNRLNNWVPIANQFGNVPISPIPTRCSHISTLFLSLSAPLLFVWPLVWMNNVASLSTSVKMEWHICSAREWDYYWPRHQPEFILISVRLNIHMYSLELCFVLFAQTVDLDAADIYMVSSMPMKGHYQSLIPSNYIPLWCVGCKHSFYV
jgi:hypothetical protein